MWRHDLRIDPGDTRRIVKTRRRIGDAAEMVAIELVSRQELTTKKKSDARTAQPAPSRDRNIGIVFSHENSAAI